MAKALMTALLAGAFQREKVMVKSVETKQLPDQPVVYQIRLKGHLGREWTEWFEGLTITLEKDGDTVLSGLVNDQAALHGILKKVRDLGMPLVSVNPVEPGRVGGSEDKSQTAVSCSCRKLSSRKRRNNE